VTEFFLKVDGIPGESADAKHKDEIELVRFSWGVEHPGHVGGPGGVGGGTGRPAFRDFSFQMRVNQASPMLFLACASGKHIKEANLSVRSAGRNSMDYLRIRFRDVLITSFEQANGDEAPAEIVAFNFGNIEFTYTAQDARGGAGAITKAGWDLSQNAKI